MRIVGELQPEEICNVEFRVITQVQVEFKDYYNAILKWGALKIKLLKLSSIIDERGLIRCDSRLVYAKFLPFDVWYPTILPEKG